MGKRTEEKPTLESLEGVRQNIRELCGQDQSTWELSWRSALVDLNEGPRGLVTPDTFHQTLAINNVVLSKRNLQALNDIFSVPNGSIDARRFLQWINLSRPVDYVDPELVYARLPQPFRRIVKILETDILDAAWNLIQATSSKYQSGSDAESNKGITSQREQEEATETSLLPSAIENTQPTTVPEVAEARVSTNDEQIPREKMSNRQQTNFGTLERDEQGSITSESLETLRQKIRRTCTNSQSTWDKSWKSILSDINQARRGLVLPDVFQEVLELNEICLAKKTLQALIDIFRVPNGAVDAKKFLKWVDMTRPHDYVDPELAFARLPQPYRRIVKILEQVIIDVAWERIKATSARYKAQASAGLTARSARSSVLLLHPQYEEPSTAHEDDFTVAKKRLCKTSKALLVGVDRGSLLFMKAHTRLPFLLLGTRCSGPEMEADRIKLQLLDIDSGDQRGSVHVDIPMNASDAEKKTCFSVLSVTDLKALGDINSESGLTLFIALNIEESCSSAEEIPVPLASRVYVYAFRVALHLDSSECTARLLTTVSFSNPAEFQFTCIEISSEAMLLAVGTTKNEVLLYSLPDTTQETPPNAAPPDGATSFEPAKLLFKMATTNAATHIFFLNAPCTTTLHPTNTATLPYALAIIAGQSIVKAVLPKSLSEPPAALTPYTVWDHLSTISSATTDISTRFLVLGLTDGLIAIWDTLEDIDYALIAPPSSTNQPIDKVMLYGQSFLTALSSQAQQLFFYDLSNQAAPSLIRSVVPPQLPRTSDQTIQPTRIVSISAEVAFLDVPITAVEYSSGYAILYDVRNGEAMGSIRVPKEPRLGHLHNSTLSNHGIVALAKTAGDSLSVQSFTWSDLLNTSFPALARVLSEKSLPKTSENVKRVYYSSVDVTVGSMALSIGGRSSLESTLALILGKQQEKLDQSTAQMSRPTSQSNLSRLSSNNVDSRTSLTSGLHSSTSASTLPSSQLANTTLPPLPKILTFPVKPTITAQFEQSCEDTLSQRYDDDTKLTRRRNDLLKILTAAW